LKVKYKMSQFETLATDIQENFTKKNNYQFDKAESTLLTILLVNLLLFIIKLAILWWLTKEKILERIKERHLWLRFAIRTELRNEFKILSRQQKLKLLDGILDRLCELSISDLSKIYDEAKNEIK
jgi:hypothetical protein